MLRLHTAGSDHAAPSCTRIWCMLQLGGILDWQGLGFADAFMHLCMPVPDCLFCQHQYNPTGDWPLQVPIVAPVKQKKVEVEEREALATFYGPESLAMLMTNPELIRNVAIVGHLHHGKTLVGTEMSAGQCPACGPTVQVNFVPMVLQALCILHCTAVASQHLRTLRTAQLSSSGTPESICQAHTCICSTCADPMPSHEAAKSSPKPRRAYAGDGHAGGADA